MKDFIQNMKAKPEHVRKRIALGASAGSTALIGILWLTTMTTTGAFALSPKSGTTADAGQKDASVAITDTNVRSNFTQLLGAVGAATNGTTSKPALTIIDGQTTSSLDDTKTTNPSATVIPF